MRTTPAAPTGATYRGSTHPSQPIVVQVGPDNDIAATTILSMTPAGLVALPHVGNADTGRFVLGHLDEGSHTVLVAWARGDAAAAPALDVHFEQMGSVLARMVATAHVAADIPKELTGVRSAYVISVRVEPDAMVITIPPAQAVVSLASIEHWMRLAVPVPLTHAPSTPTSHDRVPRHA